MKAVVFERHYGVTGRMVCAVGVDMDTVILSGLEVYGYGGVSDAEKEIGQRYRVHIEMELDLELAGRTDDLGHTVNYGEVHATVVSAVRESTFNLLEHVTARTVDRLLEQFPIERVTVRIEKPLPPIDGIVASAAVQMSRGRSANG